MLRLFYDNPNVFSYFFLLYFNNNNHSKGKGKHQKLIIQGWDNKASGDWDLNVLPKIIAGQWSGAQIFSLTVFLCFKSFVCLKEQAEKKIRKGAAWKFPSQSSGIIANQAFLQTWHLKEKKCVTEDKVVWSTFVFVCMHYCTIFLSPYVWGFMCL